MKNRMWVLLITWIDELFRCERKENLILFENNEKKAMTWAEETKLDFDAISYRPATATLYECCNYAEWKI